MTLGIVKTGINGHLLVSLSAISFKKNVGLLAVLPMQIFCPKIPIYAGAF
jgi:hypothetical protein